MTRHELASSPSLLPLYARAAVSAPLARFTGGGDGTLPESEYTLGDRRIDVDHLTAYEQVCGFSVSDVLPATYLHMLAFPLSMALMSERDFPFPLIGMVHVANSITQLRPVDAAESVSLQVHAADLRPHSAGSQFDLVAEATAAGERVWSSRSTYLRRGKPPAGTTRPDKEPRDARDTEPPSGAVAQVRVPADMGRRYAAVSGDRNPIHLYPLTAKLFGFPTAIAHGMWLKARTLAALQGRLPDAYTVDVAFKTPVLLPSTIGIAAAGDGDAPDARWTLDVRAVGSGKPHLSGTVAAGV